MKRGLDPTARMVGLELEFPVVRRSTGRGMDRRSIQTLWDALPVRDTSWSVARESATPIVTGVRRSRGKFNEHVDTDTGVCTLEVALAPQQTIGLAVEKAREVVADVQSILDGMGYTLVSAGIQPITWFDPCRKTQRDWYRLLSRRVHLHHWLVPIASHQVSVDILPSEAARVVNVLCGLSGVFVALTASSPIARGQLQPWKETRNWVWQNRLARVPKAEADYTSNAIPPRPFRDLADYIEYAWNSSVYLITDMKSRGFEVLGNRSFREFVQAEAPMPARRWDGKALGLVPDVKMLDRIHQYGWLAGKFHYHFDSSTVLADVREALDSGEIGVYCQAHLVGCYVENRTCGVAPFGEEGVSAALTVGLIEMLDEAEMLLRTQSWADWRRLWSHASEKGLDLGSSEVLGIIRRSLELAWTGLQARGFGEEGLLDPLFERLETQTVPADKMIDAFSWGGIDRLIDEFGPTS